LTSLRNLKSRAKVLIAIKRAEMGNLGKRHGVGSGVMEMIIDWGPGYRVYFAPIQPRALLLLAGGTKQTQRRDIELAKARWSDFKERSAASRFEP